MYFFYLIGTIQWSRPTKRSSIQWSRSSKWSKLNLIRRFWHFHIRNLVSLPLYYVSILVISLKKIPPIFTFFLKFYLFWIWKGLLATFNRNISCNPQFRTSNLKTNCSRGNLESLYNVLNNVFSLLDRHHPVKPPHQVK